MLSQSLSFSQRLRHSLHLYKALTKQHHKLWRPMLKRYIGEDAVVMDVGANIGNFTYIFSQLAPRGHVVAFEPGSYALSILKKVIRLRCRKNVTLLEYGLSDRDENLSLHMPVKKSGALGHGLAHIERGPTSNPTISESIPLRRLDDVAAELGLTRLDFLKIDVEGWETQALRGGASTLARYKPVIMMEMVDSFLQRAGSSSAEILVFLRGLGYETYRLDEQGNTERFDHVITEVCDVLCLHSEKATG